MDRLLSMEVFVAAVDLGSFTAAGNAFKITPAMVSKHVVALEKRLGATLLTRTTRRQSLTEIGKQYYDNCKRILAQVNDAEAGAEAMHREPKGLLRVNAPSWFGSLLLAPLVCRYLQQHPKVSVQLALTDRYIDIVDEGFDVAIRIGELQSSSLVARKIGTLENTICAAPEYIAARGLPRTPSDLLKHECLDFTNWRSQSGWKTLESRLEWKAGAAPRFESDDVYALRAAALAGIGIIMMPRELVSADIEAGRLVELMQKHVPPVRPIHAVYLKDRRSAPKLASFVRFLVQEQRR